MRETTRRTSDMMRRSGVVMSESVSVNEKTGVSGYARSALQSGSDRQIPRISPRTTIVLLQKTGLMVPRRKYRFVATN
jgi:hypothetical protein